MKAVLYVKKEKPLLLYKPEVDKNRPCRLLRNDIDKIIYNSLKKDSINGKIIAGCDYEVEEIFEELYGDLEWLHDYLPTTNTMSIVTLERRSCLDRKELCNYNGGYSTHISNLNVFNKPRALSWYNNTPHFRSILEDVKGMRIIYEFTGHGQFEKKILIPISSQEAHNILNHEQDVLVRRHVLKEMK